jgi:hypothetical protein
MVATSDPRRTYEAFKAIFVEEGRTYVERLQQLGHAVAHPESTARTYAGFAAFDATTKGAAFQTIDHGRARDIAERVVGGHHAAL